MLGASHFSGPARLRACCLTERGLNLQPIFRHSKSRQRSGKITLTEFVSVCRRHGKSVLGEVELLQRPGEVVAFPAGWWHAVVTNDRCVVVNWWWTHNKELFDEMARVQKGE